MQWIQNQSQRNLDNLNNIRLDASRHFRNNKKECLKAKFEEIVTNHKIKNIRDLYRRIIYFKKGYSLELT